MTNLKKLLHQKETVFTLILFKMAALIILKLLLTKFSDNYRKKNSLVRADNFNSLTVCNKFIGKLQNFAPSLTVQKVLGKLSSTRSRGVFYII